MTSKEKFSKQHYRMKPAQVIFLSFLVIIILGSLLLSLPFAQTGKVSYIDALFTATSATCVTGLVTIPTFNSWTLFGQIIIIGLIQIGGLGFTVLYAFLIMYLRRKISLDDRIMVQTSFNKPSLEGVDKMLRMVIKGTFLVEGIGATILFLYFKLKDGRPFFQALYWGIFHAISGFCNAGFDVIGTDNLVPYANSWVVNLTIMFLIVAGGIGFVVWREIIDWVDYKIKKKKHLIKKRFHFSVYAKLVLFSTAFLIITGAVFFFFNEYSNSGTLGNLPLNEKILASLFQSVTLRTAGFTTIDQGALKESSKFFSSIFMMIGGSSGGTAGGIKTVTIAIIIVSVLSVLKGYDRIVIMNRGISLTYLQQALTIVVIMVCFLFSSTALVSITESNSIFSHTFIDIMYECASALGTVGLTTGITPFLRTISKVILVFCMFLGRLGPMTIYLALSEGIRKNHDAIRFPKIDILIG